MTNPFAPLTPVQLADDQARRAAGEAEIARREVELAAAEVELARTKATTKALEAEFEAYRRPENDT